MPRLKVFKPVNTPSAPYNHGARKLPRRAVNDNTPPAANDNELFDRDYQAFLELGKRKFQGEALRHLLDEIVSGHPAVGFGELMDDFFANPWEYLPYLPGNPNTQREPEGDPITSLATSGEHAWWFDPKFYEHEHDCGSWPGAPPYLPGSGWTRPDGNGGLMFQQGLPAPSNRCLSGQGASGYVSQAAGTLPFGNWGTVPMSYRWQVVDKAVSSFNVHRVRYDQWYRAKATLVRYPMARPYYFYSPSADPNVTRSQPGHRPMPSPRDAQPTPAPDPEWQFEPTRRPSDQPLPRHRRQPPGRNVREVKTLTRSAKLGLALYRLLDEFSETAELVDSVYKALPKDVRKRWEKDRKRADSPADQFGQYGLEGSDWKLPAIYHNLHRLDVNEALKNIVKNMVEDKVVGGIARRLPKQNINAISTRDANGRLVGWEEQVAKLVDDFFDEIGME